MTAAADHGRLLPASTTARVIAIAGAAATLALFALMVHRYAFLGDDAFISFRYAQHLVDGHGLVFNPGERVEGYTNFLWVILMALAMKLGLAPETTANVLGIACGVAILMLVARAGARVRGPGDPLVWVAPIALATNRTFAAWSTGGLETQLFSLLLLAGLLRFDLERERGADRSVASAVILALATLTRPEGFLVFVVAGCFLAFDALVRRRRARGALATWLVVYGAIVGAHLAFRLSYYGDLVPNTFHAKVAGFWWDQSRVWLGMFVGRYGLLVFGWLALVPLVVGRRPRSLLLGAFLGVYLAYLVYVGGDIFEFRFLTPLLPAFYLLVQEGIAVITATLRERGLPRPAALAAAAVLAALAIGFGYRPNGEREPWRESGIASIEAVARYASDRAEEGRALRALVDAGYLRGDELIAVGGAGALPYYAGLPTLDVRGLNDRTIARQEISERGTIGHEKQASMDYLTGRGVVMFDVLNRLVHPAGSPAVGLRSIERRLYTGPLRCVEAEGVFLVFATTLDEASFRSRFSRFRIHY